MFPHVVRRKVCRNLVGELGFNRSQFSLPFFPLCVGIQISAGHVCLGGYLVYLELAIVFPFVAPCQILNLELLMRGVGNFNVAQPFGSCFSNLGLRITLPRG